MPLIQVGPTVISTINQLFLYFTGVQSLTKATFLNTFISLRSKPKFHLFIGFKGFPKGTDKDPIAEILQCLLKITLPCSCTLDCHSGIQVLNSWWTHSLPLCTQIVDGPIYNSLWDLSQTVLLSTVSTSVCPNAHFLTVPHTLRIYQLS